MYKIGEFAKMVGISNAAVRFYEKQGIISPERLENGYRVFSHFDAFKVNAFKTLLNYGFSISEAKKLYINLSEEEFLFELKKQKDNVLHQIESLTYRVEKIERTIDIISEKSKEKFSIENIEDYFYMPFSIGLDFSPSLENYDILSKLVDKSGISYYARKISKEEILKGKSEISISYVQVVSKNHKDKLSEDEKLKLKIFPMGQCIIYYRSITRKKSSLYDSYAELLEYLQKNKLEMRDNILILPTFLNLGEEGYDIEKIIIPIK
ncbi:MAG: MerR family transcriptional regulator [Clostridium sp.]|nr:MerR family transcriptional regulator [Clostridium sp.]